MGQGNGEDQKDACKIKHETEDESKTEDKECGHSYWKTIWQWKKWLAILIPLSGVLIFIISVVTDFILFNAIPTSAGEFRFRDIRKTSANAEWSTFNHSQGDEWKKYISSHPTNDTEDAKLGEYILITATVFLHSLGHSKKVPAMGAMDTRFLSFFLQKEGKADIYLTMEKVAGIPAVVKMVVGTYMGGIYTQISDSRDDSLRAMKDGYTRRNLDIGTLRWRDVKGSVVTLARFLRYYTQKSSHLSPGYNYYSCNCQHFATSAIELLKQLQNFDLGGNVGKETKEEKSTVGVFNKFLLNKVFQMLGSESHTEL